jgi:GxxExxY protein
MTLLHEELTEKIIGAFYKVYNTLGYAFLEKVYENALKIELTDLGLHVVAQMPVLVYYKDQVVGEYFADMCVENAVILEIKAVENLSEAQLLNYLKATGIEVGFVLNFGKKPEFRRKVFEKNYPC